jgi:hypothetical protein
MADPDALAAALAALAAAVTQLNTLTAGAAIGPGAVAAAPRAPLLDPFDTTTPFDLSSWAGSTAYATACSALDETWNGMPDTLPSFVVCLRIRSAEVKWNSPAPNGILTYNGLDLLTAHHNITETDIETVRVARTDARSKQNAQSMYECLKTSISGDLRSNLFEQASNLMTEADGPSFFKNMLSFTTVSSLQLSMLSFNQILQFDPAMYQFNVPTINKNLNHLFVLATTGTRTLDDPERIHHSLTAYQRIRQPEIWAQWVQNQVDPNHREKVKWHTHPTTECRTCTKWLEKEGGARANAGIEEENKETDDVEEDVPPNDDDPTNDLTLVLANALTLLAQDNATATELISEALQAIREG